MSVATASSPGLGLGETILKEARMSAMRSAPVSVELMPMPTANAGTRMSDEKANPVAIIMVFVFGFFAGFSIIVPLYHVA